MEEKQKKILQWVLTGIMGVGLVLIIVGMFLGLAHSEQLKLTYKLVGDEKWKLHELMTNEIIKQAPDTKNMFDSEYSYSSTFTVISFAIAIVGTVMLILNSVLKNVLHKNIKVLGVSAVLLTVIGAVMIMVAGYGLASNLGKLYWYYADPEKKVLTTDPQYFSAGAGIYLGLVGGILPAVAAVVSGIKAFKD
ncbi:MAG: hypothetical protein K2M47_00040 [Clostridiales bacterium]|nr:hypothetical protein [Clostridiales bacterium]